jgi:hypothetical protein
MKAALDMRNVLIVVLLAMVCTLAAALVRVENQRYAMAIGMCGNKSDPRLPPDASCVANARTRTSWVWHLYYAITD